MLDRGETGTAGTDNGNAHLVYVDSGRKRYRVMSDSLQFNVHPICSDDSRLWLHLYYPVSNAAGNEVRRRLLR